MPRACRKLSLFTTCRATVPDFSLLPLTASSLLENSGSCLGGNSRLFASRRTSKGYFFDTNSGGTDYLYLEYLSNHPDTQSASTPSGRLLENLFTFCPTMRIVFRKQRLARSSLDLRRSHTLPAIVRSSLPINSRLTNCTKMAFT
ncbi:hypothetical protein B0J11DRAFT_119128 [Dendryphion nanum]|uniref:Uncharacterized protein n=1 Tax=Dendryphion nanum TaxID=256645 RepID=A0A9P9IDS2_9PLEO|nr:hypothetical protein B0J11DRAFT_119128 [Dendryphion nanum]